MDRRRATGLRADRQQKFSKEVRKAALENGRKQKDAERARMEAYRRLCAAEGIQSKRLEEYDQARESERLALSRKLEEVDHDQSLTNNEKKRRKFNLKRKFAATTVTEVVGKREKKNFAQATVEEVQQRRLAEKAEKEAARREREREKKKRLGARKERSALFAQRTSRGQPVMSSRVESLLQKITNTFDSLSWTGYVFGLLLILGGIMLPLAAMGLRSRSLFRRQGVRPPEPFE